MFDVVVVESWSGGLSWCCVFGCDVVFDVFF